MARGEARAAVDLKKPLREPLGEVLLEQRAATPRLCCCCCSAGCTCGRTHCDLLGREICNKFSHIRNRNKNNYRYADG